MKQGGHVEENFKFSITFKKGLQKEDEQNLEDLAKGA